MTAPVPVAFLFDFEFPLVYRRQPPAVEGALDGWSDRELLPLFSAMDGRLQFAPVWACWNDEGLYLATRVAGKKRAPECDPVHYWKGDNLRVMIDTRDTRENRRATRFCRQYYFLPAGGGPGGRHALGGSTRVLGAIEGASRGQLVAADATGARETPATSADDTTPGARPNAVIHVASRLTAGGYNLECRIPRDAIIGFDPVEHPRIGFFYILEDREFGQQYLTVGDDLNWHMDPSTWATAVLVH